ncbi:MAG: neutral zinc metallopeptidase [Corynebacterium sp.]|nr:neutral zinc metallopeptidase [Corynebacterium sp.]
MTFKSGVSKDGDRVNTSGGRGMVIGGSSIGALILAGILWYFGIDSSQITDVLGTDTGTNQTTTNQSHCKTGKDANKYADCRVEFTAISLDGVWQEQLPAQAGLTYQKPGVTIFDKPTKSGCGVASTATGPFYCPTDQTAYFDVSFFDQLQNFGAANTPFAQEYIVAHEFGHHIQKLQNTLGMSNYNEPGPESNAVKIELQADCYAGVWAYYADKGDNAILEPISQEQLAGAIDAARAVGDDNIQQRSGGEVRPDTFTHGTSEQRQAAFLAGYQSGQMSSCPL